jgi:NADPH:quinone reductase-like Zn-dependent oxidoreductase
MKAVVHHRYGRPEVLELQDVERPELTDDGVLVRVHAAAINPADWFGVAGRPWIARPMMGLRAPRSPLVGIDFAGTVEAVGKDVTDLSPGDEVFGGQSGSLAEYVCAQKGVATKPANLTFEEAAAVPVAALTALQALRDRGHVGPGARVLINAGSGGVGTFAVQIAKALGAEVTAVCSTKHIELVRSLGADRVVDYTREDFTRGGERYDLVLDIAGSRSWAACRRVLAPGGLVVVVGGSKKNRLLGPLAHIVRMKLAALRSRQKAVFFVAKVTRPDLVILRELIEAGKVTPVVERRYELSEVADVFRALGEGHLQGKLVVTV